MSYLQLAFLAVALAMDAFAVAIAAGMALKKATLRPMFRLAWHFGLFQALMPVLGWSGGQALCDCFLRFGHWIAFALLLFIGGHMFWEGFHHKDESSSADATQGIRLIMLSVATSIDALAVGFSLSILQISIWTPALVIGITAFFFTACGMCLGAVLKYCPRIAQSAEVFGGATLTAIGTKILWQGLAS